jgi:hypothetical protein
MPASALGGRTGSGEVGRAEATVGDGTVDGVFGGVRGAREAVGKG